MIFSPFLAVLAPTMRTHIMNAQPHIMNSQPFMVIPKPLMVSLSNHRATPYDKLRVRSDWFTVKFAFTARTTRNIYQLFNKSIAKAKKSGGK